jgi:hypothetical protein
MGIAERTRGALKRKDETTTIVDSLIQKSCSEKINLLASRGIGAEFQPGDKRTAMVVEYGSFDDRRYFAKIVVNVDDERVYDYGARLWIDELN